MENHSLILKGSRRMSPSIMQGLFIWKRDAYGALSIPLLVPLSGEQRPRSDQLLLPRGHSQIKTLQCARTEQQQIAFLGKHHFVHSKIFLHSDYGEADTSSHLLAIRHRELQIFLLALNA